MRSYLGRIKSKYVYEQSTICEFNNLSMESVKLSTSLLR